MTEPQPNPMAPGIDENLALRLHRLAELLKGGGNVEAAEPLARRALAIVASLRGEDDPDYAALLTNLAGVYEDMGRYRDAVPLMQRGLQIFEAALGPDHVNVGQNADSLGRLYEELGDYAAAEAYYRQALDVCRRNLGEDHPQFARLLDRLGGLYWRLGRYTEAEEFLTRAREAMRVARGEDHPEFATVSNDLAVLYRATGRYDEAESLLLQSLEVWRRTLGDADPSVAQGLDNLAGLYEQRGDYAAAEVSYRQGLEIRRGALGDDDAVVAESLSNLGGLLLRKGDYAAAEQYLRQALEIIGATRGEDHPHYASVLGNLAVLYEDLGRYQDAEQLMTRQLEIKRKALGDGHPALAAGLGNLATLHAALGNNAAAEAHYRAALEIDRAALGEKHPDYATDLNNLGVLYEHMGRYEDAERMMRQALDIRRIVLGNDDPGIATSLNSLGILYEAMGDYAAAEPCYQEALAIVGRALGDAHPTVGTALNNLAGLYVRTGREAEGLRLQLRADAVVAKLIGHVFAISSESQRMSYVATVKISLQTLLSLVLNHLADDPDARRAALDVVLRRKAIGAEALAEQRDAVLGGRYPDLAGKLRELAELRTRIGRKLLDGPSLEGIEAHQQRLVEWEGQRQQLETDIARRIPEVGLEGRMRLVSRQSVAEALPPEASLVEFVRYDVLDFRAVPARGEPMWKPPRYAAFVLPAGEPDDVQLVDLGDAEIIDGLIAGFRASIKGVGRDVITPQEESRHPPADGKALRAALFDPLVGALGGRTRLFVAPDGDVARLPLEVLSLEDGRRIIDVYRISYLGTGRDALRFGHHPTRAAAVPFVAADPDFDLTSDEPSAPSETTVSMRQSRDLDRGTLRFRALPGTRAEGKQVAASLGVRPIMREEVLEADVKSQRSPRILHLATHGFFLPNQPLDPGRGRIGGGSPQDSAHTWFGRVSGLENPLLRSGLALAGANTSLQRGALPAEAEDGILTAEDVTGMDLLDTDLVVLSACETGLGEVHAGEGVFGLRRAFALAGAKALVMSLWKVPDEQTRELMEDFYGLLLSGRPRADALREAQLALKERHPDPLYWGAFVCQGDPGPLGEDSRP